MVSMKVIGSPLYQWEIGRQVEVIPLRNMRVDSVHFCHPGDMEALVVKPHEENGVIIADIPNILLQTGSKIMGYSVNVSKDCAETIQECIFSVRERAKPSDYVYTETEVKKYDNLEKRINALEELSKDKQIIEEVATAEDYCFTGFCRPKPKDGELFGTTYLYGRTDYIDISSYKTVTVHCRPRTESVSPCVWFDANKNYISGENASTINETDFIYEVPSGAVYAVFSSSKDIGERTNVTGTRIMDFDAKVNDSLANSALDETGEVELQLIVEKDSVVKRVNAEKFLSIDDAITLADDADYNIVGFCRPAPKDGELFGTTATYRRTDYINVSDYKTIKVHCKPNSSSVSPCVWFDVNKDYISGETATVVTETDFSYEVPLGAIYAVFSSSSKNELPKEAIGLKSVPLSEVVPEIKKTLDKIVTAHNKCYISPNGSDENDGLTADAPILTLAQAKKILASDGELIFIEGDYENLSYDLSSFPKVSTNGNVRLIYYSNKFTDAALVDGYTRVYSVPYTGNYSDYLWQFDVPDANTAISAEERHPLQRNRSFRLEHTRMYPVTKFDATSTELAGYLATMEAITDKWMYYMDGTNCYFTVPDADFVTHPVIIPSATLLKAREKRNVNISGLKIYFASILTTNLSGTLDNLTVGYHTEKGAIRWDNTFNLTLNNCEVAATTNDGINGHYDGDIACHNCWGHDCSDDGESDHEKCHIIQHGGLYEYNGSGCTPASGASGEYFGTIVRKSGAWDWAVTAGGVGTGFSSQGDGALMYCVGCYTSDCDVGFRQKSNTKATLINCVSKNDAIAFESGTQINCESFDDEHPKYETETWTFELEDGTTVNKQVVLK